MIFTSHIHNLVKVLIKLSRPSFSALVKIDPLCHVKLAIQSGLQIVPSDFLVIGRGR
jgi:hypothetical protein